MRDSIKFMHVCRLLIASAATMASVSTHADALRDASIECGAQLTVEQLLDAYSSGRLTAESVIRNCLARIERYEPQYNAFISMNPAALEDARRVDRRRGSGKRLGALAGVPIIVKESLDVAGLPSTAAWIAPGAHQDALTLIPRTDADAVERLRAADAIILGKGNMPAFSLSAANADNSWAGRTYNAVNRKLAPGGSSSGVATAVAAGFAFLGVAVESGGSIQNPAAAQALVGVKPTFGLVPTTGLLPLSTSALDVIGPHAKTVADAALMLDVLTGAQTSHRSARSTRVAYRAALDSATLQGKRIGLYGPGWGAPELAPTTRKLYDAALAIIEREGARVVRDPFGGTAFGTITTDFALKPYLYGLESLSYDLDRYFRHARFGAGIDSLPGFLAAAGNPFLRDELLLGKIWKVVNLRSTAAPHPDMYSVAWERLDAQSNATALPPLSTQPPDLAAFEAFQARYNALFTRVMATHELDFLVFPQTYDQIPEVDSPRIFPVVASPQVNILGLPAVTVPAGYHPSGAPFGLIFIGRKWSEAQLLRAAHVYEQRANLRAPPVLTRE